MYRTWSYYPNKRQWECRNPESGALLASITLETILEAKQYPDVVEFLIEKYGLHRSIFEV